MKNIFQKVSVFLIGQNDRVVCKKTWFVMEMHSWGAKRLVLAGRAARILSMSREPLSLAYASIMDTFENAAIALARWAIPSSLLRSERRGNSSLL